MAICWALGLSLLVLRPSASMMIVNYRMWSKTLLAYGGASPRRTACRACGGALAVGWARTESMSLFRKIFCLAHLWVKVRNDWAFTD